MPFILKINTDGEKFKERFDTKRDAIDRANAVMDAGTIIKGTKRSAAASYTPYKVAVTHMPVGRVVWVRTMETTHDIAADELLLKEKDDERMEQKRLWRVKEGLE